MIFSVLPKFRPVAPQLLRQLLHRPIPPIHTTQQDQINFLHVRQHTNHASPRHLPLPPIPMGQKMGHDGTLGHASFFHRSTIAPSPIPANPDSPRMLPKACARVMLRFLAHTLKCNEDNNLQTMRESSMKTAS